MSSSMPAPSDLFENLTLDPQMSSTVSDVSLRAVEVRDILSSFDRNILPAEFKHQIFTQLDRSSHERPPLSQWTIQEDLQSSLLQWGSYSEEAYELLRRLQSGSTLARLFHEKLARRFKELFDQYDRPVHEYEQAVPAEIQRIARGLREIVAAVREDRPYRELGQETIAMRLLEAMIDVCRRHADLISYSEPSSAPRQSTYSTTSSADDPLNLYEALIEYPPDDQAQSPFMLDVLETFPVSAFVNLESQHAELMQLLEVNDAPREYKYRIGRLLNGMSSRATAESGGIQTRSKSTTYRGVPVSLEEPPLPASGSSQVSLQAQVPATGPARTTPMVSSGAKRSADDPSTATRRGKKKTGR